MADKTEMGDELPAFEEFESETADTQRWQPSPEIQDQILEGLKGVFPLKLRPSDLVLEQHYDKGHQLYKAGRYKAALIYFRMLMMINPKNPKYLLATAACLHMQKDYFNAVDYYGMAAILDDKNPIPQYHMAGCMIKLEQPIGAMIALEMGLLRCDSPRYKGLKERMQMMIARLDKELLEKKAAGLPYMTPTIPPSKQRT